MSHSNYRRRCTFHLHFFISLCTTQLTNALLVQGAILHNPNDELAPQNVLGQIHVLRGQLLGGVSQQRPGDEVGNVLVALGVLLEAHLGQLGVEGRLPRRALLVEEQVRDALDRLTQQSEHAGLVGLGEERGRLLELVGDEDVGGLGFGDLPCRGLGQAGVGGGIDVEVLAAVGVGVDDQPIGGRFDGHGRARYKVEAEGEDLGQGGSAGLGNVPEEGLVLGDDGSLPYIGGVVVEGGDGQGRRGVVGKGEGTTDAGRQSRAAEARSSGERSAQVGAGQIKNRTARRGDG